MVKNKVICIQVENPGEIIESSFDHIKKESPIFLYPGFSTHENGRLKPLDFAIEFSFGISLSNI